MASEARIEKIAKNIEWVSEWFMFNAKRAFFQLYFLQDDNDVHFLLDKHV
jgi:hypothetical protein